jgi:hypothetical protein
MKYFARERILHLKENDLFIFSVQIYGKTRSFSTEFNKPCKFKISSTKPFVIAN